MGILRANSKLEVACAAEIKATSILTSLSHTLEKLKTETEEARKKNDDLSQEVTATKEDIQKVEFEIDMTKERLQGVLQQLEVHSFSISSPREAEKYGSPSHSPIQS
ncbi:hypothetical protein V8G54_022800 [Vigna mungo]|uniref:Uncharacterized protein n=1 Tax=Vigna mungo TaxID=3915 RepID=A0AAQ3N332_VIGMU